MQTSALEPAVTLDDIAHLDTMVRELGVASSVANQQIKRLVMAGFGNPVRADHNLRKLLREEGVESAIRVLEDRASRPRWHYLGFPRGRLPERMQGLWMPKGMIAPRAQEALRELPTALREYATVRAKLLDLQNSRAELRARVPGRAPLSATRTPDRQNERSR